MRIHYFQRYHQKENVATANTMLLLSRLYQYSPDKFYRALKDIARLDNLEAEPIFTIQEKNEKSIPDATISQAGFKLVVETKRYAGAFSLEQLEHHLNAFGRGSRNVLLTLAPTELKPQFKDCVKQIVAQHNRSYDTPVRHAHATFTSVIEAVGGTLDERDYEMQEILDDFRDYCEHDGLTKDDGAETRLRMQLANATFDYAVTHSLYYCSLETRLRDFRYLGLYRDKSLRAIGTVTGACSVSFADDQETMRHLAGQVPEDWKNQILDALDHEVETGVSRTIDRKFFFVDRFYETNFRKVTSGASMGGRVFDLCEVLGLKELPETEEIASLLNQHTWE